MVLTSKMDNKWKEIRNHVLFRCLHAYGIIEKLIQLPLSNSNLKGKSLILITERFYLWEVWGKNSYYRENSNTTKAATGNLCLGRALCFTASS